MINAEDLIAKATRLELEAEDLRLGSVEGGTWKGKGATSLHKAWAALQNAAALCRRVAEERKGREEKAA